MPLDSAPVLMDQVVVFGLMAASLEARLLHVALTLCSLGRMGCLHTKNVVGRLVLVPGKSEGFLVCQAKIWKKMEPPCLVGVGRGISLQWVKDMKAELGIPCDFIRLHG